ncbi:MAG: FtsQ-type POTRA domain-containing protein [Anaerolineales bacterium]|nr:FtsQ-type POTRA domain-containing protein [Anaerolineales bacterium]
MTLSERALTRVRTRAERVRNRRARVERGLEPAPREIRKKRSPRRRMPRRRYDVELSVTRGAEMQLPALPRFRVGLRLLSAVLVLALAWSLGEALSMSRFRVDQVEVSGNHLLTAAQVQSIVSLTGREIFSIDPLEVSKSLVDQPEIVSAMVDLSLPNKVVIEVEERSPEIAWNDAGRTWWLSTDGIAFMPQSSRDDLITVETNTAVLNIHQEALEPVISPDLIRNAIVLSHELKDVSPLQYDTVHGFGFKDPHGWMVYFGEEGDMAMKVRVYRVLVEALAEKEVQVTLVSLENQAAAYYRVER